jgi:hypothetical protein
MTTIRTRIPSSSPGDLPVRRSTAGFWLAGLIAVLGLVGAIVWAAVGTFNTVDSTADLTRADIPGTIAVAVTEPGHQVIYYEGVDVPSLQRLELKVTGPDGRSIAVAEYSLTLEYDSPTTSGTVGTAVARFWAAGPGTYRVATAFDPATPAQLAVGDDIAKTFLTSMVGPVVLASGTLAVALAIILVTVVGRRPRRPAETVRT